MIILTAPSRGVLWAILRIQRAGIGRTGDPWNLRMRNQESNPPLDQRSPGFYGRLDGPARSLCTGPRRIRPLFGPARADDFVSKLLYHLGKGTSWRLRLKPLVVHFPVAIRLRHGNPTLEEGFLLHLILATQCYLALNALREVRALGPQEDDSDRIPDGSFNVFPRVNSNV